MKSSKGIYIKDNYDDNNNHDNHFKIEKRYKHSVSVLTPCIQIINFQHTTTLPSELGCHNIYFIVALHYNGHSQADVHTEDSVLQPPPPRSTACNLQFYTLLIFYYETLINFKDASGNLYNNQAIL